MAEHRPWVSVEADIFVEDTAMREYGVLVADMTASVIAREGWDQICSWVENGYLPVVTVHMVDGSRVEVDLEDVYREEEEA